MFALDSFQGKRILITGAGSGIGRATAILLSQLGAELVLVGRDVGKLHETQKLTGVQIHSCVSADVCNFSSYDALFNQITEKGKLNGFLHCAGIAPAIPVKTYSADGIHRVLDTNLVSFLMLVKWFSKVKYSGQGASIVACSAVNVHYPQKCMAVYEASKSALEAAVRGMAEELYERRKLRINAMVIGPVATPMGGVAEGDISLVGNQSSICPNLMGVAAPVSIAQMAAFLLDDLSAYTTGRNFYVDGGRLG